MTSPQLWLCPCIGGITAWQVWDAEGEVLAVLGSRDGAANAVVNAVATIASSALEDAGSGQRH